MRLFFALWPDEMTRTRLAALQHGLKGRKTRSGNLHITLAFLGEQPESLLPDLQDLLQALSVPDMRLLIDHIIYKKRQRMVWAGMHQIPEALPALQRDVCAGLEQRGIAFDRRNHFTPHITLARDAAPTQLISFEAIAWQACQVSLVQSVIESSGVVYKILTSQFCKAAIEGNESNRA